MATWTSSDGRVELWCGDAREILPSIPAGAADAVITDPVWLNALPILTGADDPCGLFTSVIPDLERIAPRLAVHLGCDTSPIMLAPITLPFFRVCWLRYARPHYKGRLLYGSDVAYLYGEPPRSRKGAHVIPGEVCKVDSNGRVTEHPCERSLEHVEFLVKYWGGRKVLDPFGGSQTTGAACVKLGLDYIGIEINPFLFEIGKDRISRAIEEKAAELPLEFAEPEQLNML